MDEAVAIACARGEIRATGAGSGDLPGLSRRTDTVFQECFAAHYPALTGYCAALLGNAHTAHDVAQEAFTRLFARWSGVRDPRAYVFWVATNLVRELWRRRRVERAAIATLEVTAVDRVPGHDPWLRDLVERLPERYRQVVLLHYYADVPTEEVARMVHRPLGTVKRQLHEARNLLLDAVERADD